MKRGIQSSKKASICSPEDKQVKRSFDVTRSLWKESENDFTELVLGSKTMFKITDGGVSVFSA